MKLCTRNRREDGLDLVSRIRREILRDDRVRREDGLDLVSRIRSEGGLDLVLG